MIRALPALPLFLLAACAPVEQEGQINSAADSQRKIRVASKHPGNTRFRPVQDVSRRVTGDREVLKAAVNGRNLVAVLSWRPYHADLDGQVKTWYGDMGEPPPRFVVDSLRLTVDQRTVRIPWARTRSLCSQWKPKLPSLSLLTSGSNLGLTVSVGDGAESWTSSYLINPTSLRLLSHQVEDGPTFDNYSVDY